MILKDAYTSIARRTSLDSTDSTSKSRMRDAMKFALKEMYRRCKFMAMTERSSFDTVDGTQYYYLDDRALYFTGFNDEDNSSALEMWTIQRFNKEYANPSTDTQSPDIIVPIKRVWCANQPSVSSALTCTSNGTETSIVNVFVRGMSSGIEKTETIAIPAGVSQHAHSVYSYTDIISISKDTSVGTIAITADTGTVTAIMSLLPAQKEKTYWKVMLYPTPNDAYTINYTFYRDPWDSIVDEDVLPMEERFIDAFLDFTTGYILQWQGDIKFQVAMKIGSDKLQEIMSNDYFSEDEDLRMGLIELSQEGDNW